MGVFRNPSKAKDIMDLYFSNTIRDMSDDQYESLYEQTGRHVNIIQPKYFFFDIDGVEVANYCAHFGCWEYKHANQLEEEYNWDKQRIDIKKTLVEANYQIEYITLRNTVKGRKGFRDSSGDVIQTNGNYDVYLRNYIRKRASKDLDGRGWFILLFRTEDCKYFSPINFSGSEKIFKDDDVGMGVGKGKVRHLLNQVGDLIQPCFDEYLLFLLRDYLRQDNTSIFDHLSDNENRPLTDYLKKKSDKLVWFEEVWHRELSDALLKDDLINLKKFEEMGDNTKKLVKWFAFSDVMEDEILDRIHFDTMLDNHDRYEKLVEMVRNRRIGDFLIDKFKSRLKYHVNGYGGKIFS